MPPSSEHIVISQESPILYTVVGEKFRNCCSPCLASLEWF